jgi:glycosyltransferase involved in cell wall biosynthesis
MVLGWFGRLDHPKRPDIWVEILRQAAMAGMTIRGIVIGAGPLEKQMRAAVQSAEVDVEFLGEMGPAEAFSRMDVLLTWSDSEGVPFTIQEAIWGGIPCLSNDLPGPKALLGFTPESIVDQTNAVGMLEHLRGYRFRAMMRARQLEYLTELKATGKPEVAFESCFRPIS